MFLLDFNPYSHRTDSLLFSWEELQRLRFRGVVENPQDQEEIDAIPILRVVESEAQASQSMPRHSHNRYPKDVVGLSDGTSIAEFAQKWRDALQEAVSDKQPSTRNSRQADSMHELPGR